MIRFPSAAVAFCVLTAELTAWCDTSVSPTPLSVGVTYAVTALERGRTADAIALLEMTLCKNPADLSARWWLGCALQRQGRLTAAEREFRRVLMDEPRSVPVMLRLGEIREQLGDRPAARSCFRHALTVDPGCTSAQKNLRRLESQLPAADVLTSDGYPWPVPPSSALLHKLLAGREVRIVFLGDSIAFGIGVNNVRTETYPAIFAHDLRQAFDDPNVHVINVSCPGLLIGYAAEFLHSHVFPQNPDLVVVQLGGSDSREKTPQWFMEDAVPGIVHEIRSHSHADVILCVQPFLNQTQEDHDIPSHIRSTGASLKIPVADFNTVLDRTPGDYRGVYTHDSHPTEYQHRIMAQELWRSFAQLVHLQPALRIGIVESHVQPVDGTAVTVRCRIENRLPQPQRAEVLLDAGGTTSQKIRLGPRELITVSFAVPVPASRSDRSIQIPVRAVVRSIFGAACDAKRLTLRPVLGCPPPGASRQQTLWRLGMDHVLLGSHTVTGEHDLSAVVSLTRAAATLHITVNVLDDALFCSTSANRADRDCVEIFVDARPEADQGRPYNDPRVFLIEVMPAKKGADWGTLDPPPPHSGMIHVTSVRHAGGYRVEATLALTFLQNLAGAPLRQIGFDVAVDDSDTGQWRDAQLVGAGTLYNYLDPAAFAVLDFGADQTVGWAATLY